MNQEDWRYRDFRKNSGTWYWAVSFLGIHLFPTLIVFAAATPVYAGLSENISGITLLRVVGVVICLFGTALELIADRQMREFREEHDRKGAVCTSGLWAYSRHPNYLGELLFWWGIFVFSLPGAWPWHAAGPVLMTMLFVFISIPMMERHLLSRKPEYAEIKDEVPMLIPLKVGAERSTADRGM